MEVLKVIYTNEGDIFKDDPDDIPLKLLCSNTTNPSKVEASSSEDEDEEEVKRKQFSSRIASYQFEADANKMASNSIHLANIIEKKFSLSQEGKRILLKQGNATNQLPILCDSIMPTLRGFPNCPICLQPFPILSMNDEATQATAVKRKKAKKVVIRNAVTGAARLQHVKICAFRQNIAAEIVTSLVKSEKIRLDRNTRQEYSEKVNNQPLWKTLTGDEPPNTQAQVAATTRKRRFNKAFEQSTPAKKSKSKATSNIASPAAFKAGKRGGLSRASTTILAPRLTRAQVKSKCCELFGRPEMTPKSEHHKDVLSDYMQLQEGTARSRKAAAGGKLLLGLGVGICSLLPSKEPKTSSTTPTNLNPRLGMGYNLGSIIAQRYKASD